MQLVQENLLHLLKDSLSKGSLQTNYEDYGLSLEDVINFTKGCELKMLCGNSDENTLERTKLALKRAGIDYTKRTYTLKCRKFDCESGFWLKYDFLVEMSDEEFEAVCAENERILSGTC